MNEENKFYIDDSNIGRIVAILGLIFFGIFCLLLAGISLDCFELGDWISGIEFAFFGLLLGLCAFSSIITLVHMGSYIEIGDNCLIIYKPKRRYSFKFIKYDVKYDDIYWCYFRDIKCFLHGRGARPSVYRFLFMIKLKNDKNVFVARTDWSSRWIHPARNLSKYEIRDSKMRALKEILKSQEIRLYDSEKHSNEFKNILQQNKYSIRMGYFYKRYGTSFWSFLLSKISELGCKKQ